MRKLTSDEVLRHPERIVCGGPYPRPLHQWICLIGDLLRDYKVHVEEPLDWCNFVAMLVTWTQDADTYNTPEHWPGCTEEVRRVIEGRQDDCDGKAVLVASVLYTRGFRNVRIALGWYGHKVPDPAFANHAYCLWHRTAEPDALYVLDPSPGEIVRALPLLRDCPQHNTLLSANALGEYWAHGAWEDW